MKQTTEQAGLNPGIPMAVKLLGIVHLFLGMGGLMGGYFLTTDPTGSSLGVSVGLLERLPISDFLIPGLILLIILGILPFFAIYALWMKPLPRKQALGYHWSWWLSGGIGVFLVGWTIGEIILWGWVGLSVGYCVVGAMIIAGGFSKNVRQYLQIR